eukprot:gene6903-14016_t
MEPYTTLVYVNSETASNLVSYVSGLFKDAAAGASFLSECEVMITSSETSKLLNKILEQADLIISSENDKDAEGCFNAFVTILFSVESEEESLSIVKSLIESVSSNVQEQTKIRLRILVSLFNLLTSYVAKFEVLKGIFAFAIKSNQTTSIIKYHTRIESWTDSWSISSTEKRELYSLVAQVLTKDSKDSLPLSFLVKYLDLFVGEKLPEDVIAVALFAVVGAIKSPISSFPERMALMELEDGDLKKLFTLLHIICADTIEAYKSFETQNQTLLTKYDIPQVEVQRAMRLLTLCSLGASDANLPYEKIAASLNIPIDEVESCVVDAISQGLMDASMDQFHSIVSISRCVHRSFGQAQWTQLQHKLLLWKKNVTGALESMKRH